jgi:hypothetical protein
MDFQATQFNDMAQWDYRQPHVLELKMEDVIQDQTGAFIRIFRFLGLLDERPATASERVRFRLMGLLNEAGRVSRGVFPFQCRIETVSPGAIANLVQSSRFQNLAGRRRPGQEDVRSHYRKGVAGDWVNHFTARHVEEFKRRYNDLLLKLGYEKNADWVHPEATMETKE